MLRFLFPLSLFLSALLLFSIQPMVAKALLPTYGGTPAVWIVCMLFFQFILLISYGYVWGISLFKRSQLWRVIHLILAAASLLILPQLFHASPLITQPEWGIFYNLMTQLGLPLLIVGASAPLLQYAYSQTNNKGAHDPYFLYTASNVGSFIALLAYPFIVERFIGLTQQFQLWRLGYFGYLSLLVFILLGMSYPTKTSGVQTTIIIPWRQMGQWIFLSFIPCSLMLGVTLYITTDVAATPLFWILPLTLYLFSFIVTFRSKPFISQAWVINNTLLFLVFTVLGFILGISQIQAWQLVLFNVATFFVLAVLCHGQLFLKRPDTNNLTLFYFCLAVGGVLAGIFNSLIAPHCFNQIYEYPLAILGALLVLPIQAKTQKLWVFPCILIVMLLACISTESHWFGGLFTLAQLLAIASLIGIIFWAKHKLDFLLALLTLFIFIFTPLLNKNHVLLQQRNFYGVKQILEKEGVHVLLSQSTVHGIEDMNATGIPSGLTSYYGAIAPAVSLMEDEHQALDVIGIGLGTGTIACQFRLQDKLNIIEIDPQMIALAKNPRLFQHLSKCLPQVNIHKADGRLALAHFANKSQDLILVDAFNSDAIPVHLLTIEAFTLYQKKLKEGGAILVNLSNRHMELLPIVYAAGRHLEWMVLSLQYIGDSKLGQFNSEWALLTANEAFAATLIRQNNWHFVAQARTLLWTDDYSNIAPLLKH